jgi:hypothetical protein
MKEVIRFVLLLVDPVRKEFMGLEVMKVIKLAAPYLFGPLFPSIKEVK